MVRADDTDLELILHCVQNDDLRLHSRKNPRLSPEKLKLGIRLRCISMQ